jgi:flagellar hook assembly protein FlgD
MFQFRIPEPTDVSFTLHDITGRCVAVLAGGFQREGLHAITWDGRDRGGHEVASGTYFARLVVGKVATTEKVVLVR